MSKIIKVLALTKYSSQGASSRLRTLQYLPYLEGQGINVEINSLYDNAYLNKLYATGKRTGFLSRYLLRLKVLFSAARYDLVWIEKEVFPFCPALVERFFKLFRIPYVVDYDDAIYSHYQLSKHWLVRVLLKHKISKVMQLSSHVSAGNQHLADYAKSSGAKAVSIIPTVPDLQRYHTKAQNEEQSLVIGWIGSPTTQVYLYDIAEQLAWLAQKYSVRLHLMGATEDAISNLPNTNLEIFPWSEAGEVPFIQNLDIGIMPLKDGPWEKGKCGYKLIQYMACGVSVVGSPVGVNEKIVVESDSGLLADTPESWQEALVALLESKDKREGYANNGRKAVEEYYSLQVQQVTLANVLRDVAGAKQGEPNT